MAGPGVGPDRHEPCLLCRVGDAPHLAAIERSGRQAGARPFRKGGGLHGRRLCPGGAAAGGLHGAIGRSRQSRFRAAGSLAWAQPGHRADRTQGAFVPAPQFLSGDPARAVVLCCHQVLQPGLCHDRAAAAVAPCLARLLGRDAAPDASRFQRAAGRCHRARPDIRTADVGNRTSSDPCASAGRRGPRYRAPRGLAEKRTPRRDRRGRWRRDVAGRAGGARLG